MDTCAGRSGAARAPPELWSGSRSGFAAATYAAGDDDDDIIVAEGQEATTAAAAAQEEVTTSRCVELARLGARELKACWPAFRTKGALSFVEYRVMACTLTDLEDASGSSWVSLPLCTRPARKGLEV